MLRCPECGCSDLYDVLGGYAGATYRCRRCGYTGTFVVESDEAFLPISKEDVSGTELRFPIGFCVKVAALLLLLFFIFNLLINLSFFIDFL